MNFLRITSVAVLLFAIAFVVPTASASCTNANLTGVWGYQVGITVGQFMADGLGNITAGSQTTNQNGTVLAQTFTGTYAVAANCTGNITVNITGGGSAHVFFVLDLLKRGAQVIDTDSGGTGEGIALAEGAVTCGLTGVSQTFAAELFGKVINTGGLAYVAQVVLDGTGKVSGFGTFDVAGTIVKSSFTGTYTENANCNGTLQITPAKFNALSFYFVVARGGKQILLLDTDSNAQAAGSMQQ